MSMTSTTRPLPAALTSGTTLLILAVAAACALMLALPGQTATTKYVNDTFIFLDGAYRISVGQVPNREFHTALGPLTYYIPVLGMLLSGGLGAALPVGMAFVILLASPMIAYVLGSRLSRAIAAGLGITLLLVLAAPINLGEQATAVSFGMYYNRIGWVLLSVLLVLHLSPRPGTPHRADADAFCAAAITITLLYLKITYGLVALAFLVMSLVTAQEKRWAALGLAGSAAAVLVIELFWRGTAGHLADIRLASQVSGGIRGTAADHVRILLSNLTEYVFLAILVALALWRTRGLREVLFFGFCAAASYLLMSQNFQVAGMITLLAGGAVAAETVMRSGATPQADSVPRRFAALVLFLAFLAPTALQATIALGTHTVAAAGRAGEPFPLPGFEGLRLVDVWTGGDHGFSQHYLNTVRSGGLALDDLVDDPGRVFVLDFVDPFTAGLGLEPARGINTWQHWGRNFDAHHVLPAADAFRDVQVVMDPKRPVEWLTADGLRRAYLHYIQNNFEFAGENGDWWIYVAEDLGSRSPRAQTGERQDGTR